MEDNKLVSTNLNQHRWRIKNKDYIPILVGGMGVDISSDKLAIEVASLNGIGHISDAMVSTVTDRHYSTKFSKEKFNYYKNNKFNFDKTSIKFSYEDISKATKIYVEGTLNKRKNRNGLLFINCMEKLLMNNPRETLKARFDAALDAGIDGITLSAGLHLNSFELMSEHPRFNDALLGIIISSVRALRPFLKKGKRYNRLPDYIIVEGPKAGGHLGFGMDWAKYDLKNLVKETLLFLSENDLKIPVIAAGGVFTGTDAVNFINLGVSAVQVATRFVITKECGLPDRIKQYYFSAEEEDIIVSQLSPTGYPMRILKNSPGLTQYIRPNCETYGFLLKNGKCGYIDSYKKAEEKAKETGLPMVVEEKVCLCTHMRNYKIWTCGETAYRLKDTSIMDSTGKYQLLDAKHVFNDYLYSKDHNISLPTLNEEKLNRVEHEILLSKSI